MNGQFRALAGRHQEKGMSLVELMVAMAIGLVILTVLTILFVNLSSNKREIDRSASVLENGRYALGTLGNELGLAGYYGTLSVPLGTTDEPCSHDIAKWNDSMALYVRGSDHTGDTSDDFDACFTTTPALPGRQANTDAVIIQRVSTCVAGPTTETGCTAKESASAYLQVSECGEEYKSTPSTLAIGSGTFSLKNRVAGGTNCGAAGTAPIRRYYRSLYYIDLNSNLVRADFIPSGAYDTTVIAENIENFQIQYGFDTNGDGTADSFSAPSATSAWQNVVGMRVWLLVRAPTATPGYSSGKSYAMDNYSVTPTDGYQRHVFTSFIPFINPAGRRFQ